jgi:hypothetical protein
LPEQLREVICLVPVPGLLVRAVSVARTSVCRPGLPGGAREVGGDDVGRVPVQAAAGPVIPHRRPRIGMESCLLHVPQRHPGIQTGDERVPQRVRGDGLGDPGAAGGPADDPPGAVPVQPPPFPGQEYWAFGALADGQVDRPGAVRDASGMVTTLPPLRVTVRVRCPRSRPRCSTSSPVASDTRSPLSASSKISA